LSRLAPDLCIWKRHSEQSRAGVTDECFGVAAVGLEHFERKASKWPGSCNPLVSRAWADPRGPEIEEDASINR
jgi:hypothetical protein